MTAIIFLLPLSLFFHQLSPLVVQADNHSIVFQILVRPSSLSIVLRIYVVHLGLICKIDKCKYHLQV